MNPNVYSSRHSWLGFSSQHCRVLFGDFLEEKEEGKRREWMMEQRSCVRSLLQINKKPPPKNVMIRPFRTIEILINYHVSLHLFFLFHSFFFFSLSFGVFSMEKVVFQKKIFFLFIFLKGKNIFYTAQWIYGLYMYCWTCFLCHTGKKKRKFQSDNFFCWFWPHWWMW